MIKINDKKYYEVELKITKKRILKLIINEQDIKSMIRMSNFNKRFIEELKEVKNGK